MPHELIQVRVRNPLSKILLLLLLIVAGVWSYFAVSWYIGNTFAEYSDPNATTVDIAHRAVSMAPKDPLTHWRMAQVAEKTLTLDKQGAAIAEYEKAVSLSPNDYRFWMSLGRAYEQVGEASKAEQALRRAVTLAPSYAYPHWYLGNLFLRNARYDEAFAELRLASQADPELRPQQFNLVWAIYSDDPEGLKNAVGPTAAVRAAFALYLISQQHLAEGLRLWDSLSADEKIANRDSAQQMIQSLFKDFKFHAGLKVWNDIATEKFRTEVGHVFDDSFELSGQYGSETVFGWQARGAPQVQIGADAGRMHGGVKSLRFVFDVRANVEAVNVYQLVPIQPQTTYDLEFYVSTDKLTTAGAPQIDIVDPTDTRVLISSAMAPVGTNGWNRVSVSFKTGEKTEAVIIKIVRFPCVDKETPVCPIFGTVWYDDFTITRRN
jgi:Tetratricopeptide repeat